MKIYKVSYEDLNYRNKNKLFLQVEKAEEYSKSIINDILELIKKNTDCYRLYTEEEYNDKIVNSDKRMLEIFSEEYPIVIYRLTVFEDNIKSFRINYFYIQDDEEYEQSFDVDINELEVVE